MNTPINIVCANCHKDCECELYAHDTAFGTALSYFCKDCWVIVYGEGKYIKHE